MNRGRREKRARVRDGCSGKVRFLTVDQATNRAVSMIENIQRVHKIFVYLCRQGAHYHLSTRDGSEVVRVVEVET